MVCDIDAEPKRLFSPLQTFLASFFGGPIAAIYILRANSRVLQRPDLARVLGLAGILVLGLLLLSIPFLPESLPKFTIALAYSGCAAYVVGQCHKTSGQIRASDEYEPRRARAVVGVIVASLAALFIVLVIAALVLTMGGLTAAP